MAKLVGAPKEIDIQAGFRAKLRYVAPAVCLVAVPNAAKRSQWAAMQAKREGMATGFPDVMVMSPGRIGFLEFKTAKGRVSEAQVEWLDRLTRYGFPCAVVRSVDEAIDFLRRHDFPLMERAAPASPQIERTAHV